MRHLAPHGVSDMVTKPKKGTSAHKKLVARGKAKIAAKERAAEYKSGRLGRVAEQSFKPKRSGSSGPTSNPTTRSSGIDAAGKRPKKKKPPSLMSVIKKKLSKKKAKPTKKQQYKTIREMKSRVRSK